MSSEVKNRKDKRTAGKTGFKPAQFINYTLTQDDKSRLAEFLERFVTSQWDIYDKLVEAGYKLSVAYDSYNECVAAFLSTSDEKNPNFGLVLSGRARSAQMAIVGALYRHYIVFEEQWPVRDANRAGLDDD